MLHEDPDSHVADVNGSDVNHRMQPPDLGTVHAFPEDYMCGPLIICTFVLTYFSRM